MELNELSPNRIVSGPIPWDDMLTDSVFYPASLTDGRPIQLCNTVWRRLGVNSFVYCDYGLSERAFLANTHTMHGYHVLARRHIDPSEYIPDGWRLEMVPERGDDRRTRYWDTMLGHGGPDHCACWVVFERDANMSPTHGPERLSVLFVCGEGLATFQQLYCSRVIAPKMLCFIQCWGFAGNWTNFSGYQAPFHRTLVKYKECTPEWLCFGDYKHIHGVIRLRELEYARIRCLGYQTEGILKARFGDEPTVVSSAENRRAFEYTAGGRRLLAVSVSHQMEYAVYDITHSRLPQDPLLDWLILTDPGNRGNHEFFLNEWAGIVCFDKESGPLLDEKLNWRRLDRFESVAKAIAIVRSAVEIYGQNGVRACSPLMREAMMWAGDILERSAPVRLENGLPSFQRVVARDACRAWMAFLPSFSEHVWANTGFGRDVKALPPENGVFSSELRQQFRSFVQ